MDIAFFSSTERTKYTIGQFLLALSAFLGESTEIQTIFYNQVFLS